MNRGKGLAEGSQTYQREQRHSVQVNLTSEQRDNIPTLLAPSDRHRLSNAINLAVQESDRELGSDDYIDIINRLQTSAITALELISMHQKTEVDTIINQLILNYLDQYRGRI